MRVLSRAIRILHLTGGQKVRDLKACSPQQLLPFCLENYIKRDGRRCCIVNLYCSPGNTKPKYLHVPYSLIQCLRNEIHTAYPYDAHYFQVVIERDNSTMIQVFTKLRTSNRLNTTATLIICRYSL